VTVLDERGRVAGRFNVVDIAAAIVVFALVPVALGAYLLFRTPAQTLVSIVPATVFEGSKQRVEIDGANLRPFMRVSFGTKPAGSFLLGSTKYALVDLPELKPGAYDVVLYDYMQEVARLPKALTIAPVATEVKLEVAGKFKSLAEAAAAQLKVRDRFPSGERPTAEIIELGATTAAALRVQVGDDVVTVPQGGRDVEATLLITCSSVRMADGSARCAVPGPDQQTVVVAPNALIALSTPNGAVIFQVAAARAPRAAAPESR